MGRRVQYQLSTVILRLINRVYLNQAAHEPSLARLASGKPKVYFLYFFYLLQAEKVPMLESTTYLKKEIPSTF